jgi:dihydrofolate reductase
MIVAMAANRCIGAGNRMPWHLPADLKHFKQATLGCPVIMGRKTYESILGSLGKPLPGRTSILITRNLNYQPQGAAPGQVLVADTPQGALAVAGKLAGADGALPRQVFVVGGAEIYRAMLPAADRLVVTEIHQDFAGDAFFPVIEPHLWQESRRDPQPRSGDPAVDFDFVEYQRRAQQ